MACWHSWPERLRVLGLGLAIALAASGCRNAGQDAEKVSTATILWPGEYLSDIGLRWVDSELKFLVFLPLASVNERGELEGVLARRWEHSPDYRSLTVHLRDDVRWHDGVPFTARDVEFTINLFKHPEALSYFDWGQPAEHVTVHDDSTFTITHDKVAFYSLYWTPDYFNVFYPKHLLEGLDPAEIRSWEFWREPVGNGPYRFVRYVPATAIEFEANPDYYRGKPRIERVVIRSGTIQDLLAEHGDAIDFRVESDAQFLMEDDRFQLYHEFWVDIGWMNVVLWNQRHPALGDARVRRALSLAVDRPLLAHALMRPLEAKITDAPYTDRQYWRGDLPEPLPYDPVEAERLLEEAGWRDVDGDGVRELSADQSGADGRELEFSLLTWPAWERGAVFVQAQWQRVGVNAKILTLDSGVLRERIRAGDFDAAITGIMTEPLGWVGLLHFFGRESPAGYSNSRVISLLEDALGTTHPDRVDAIYRELAHIFLRDLPYLFLAAGSETFVAHRRLKGLSTPFRANPTWAMEHLWIEDDG